MTHPDLSRKVSFLRRPTSYPDEPSRVDAVETHMAWVFLTDRYAYKLKKPVRTEFLDFSTLELREEDCRTELYLNRRLADGVYLGTLPITEEDGGTLRLAGDGAVVDWLVHMRRLSEDMMLDERIRRETLTEDQIRRVAVLLSDFYRRTPSEPLTADAYRRRLLQDTDQNRRVLTKREYDLPPDLLAATFSEQLRFVEKRGGLLDERVRKRCIVEGHGDLRPEHVCVETRPVIFDCLEFNREFRIVDPADEFAFLAMECDRLGATFVGAMMLDTYSSVTGDRPAELLVRFYKSMRACLRAKLCVWHLEDHDVDVEKWRGRAREYVDLAAAYAGRIAETQMQ